MYPLTSRNVAHKQLERLDQQWQATAFCFKWQDGISLLTSEIFEVELQKEKPALLSAMTRAFFTEACGHKANVTIECHSVCCARSSAPPG